MADQTPVSLAEAEQGLDQLRVFVRLIEPVESILAVIRTAEDRVRVANVEAFAIEQRNGTLRTEQDTLVTETDRRRREAEAEQSRIGQGLAQTQQGAREQMDAMKEEARIFHEDLERARSAAAEEYEAAATRRQAEATEENLLKNRVAALRSQIETDGRAADEARQQRDEAAEQESGIRGTIATLTQEERRFRQEVESLRAELGSIANRAAGAR